MRKWTVVFALLALLPAIAFADDKSSKDCLCELKAYGYLPETSLQSIRDGNANVDLDQYQDVLAYREELRCGHPDYADNELANTAPERVAQAFGWQLEDCQALVTMHSRMLEAQGSGSWGICIPDLYPDNHAIYYYLDESNLTDYYRRKVGDAEIDRLASAGVWGTRGEIATRYRGKTYAHLCMDLGLERTYARTGIAWVPTKERSKARVIIRLRFIPGGVIGVGWFPRAGCSDVVEFHIDTSYTPSDVQDAIDLWAHEGGHTLGLPHTFQGQNRHRGVLSYRSWEYYYGFVNHSLEGVSYPEHIPDDPSLPRLVRFFGGEPIPEGEDPTDPEPPTPPTGGDGFDLQPGEELTLSRSNGESITLVVKESSGPDFRSKLAGALAKVPDYEGREKQQQILVALYQSTAQAMVEDKITLAEGLESIKTMRQMALALTGGNGDKWKSFFAVADAAGSVEQFKQSADVLLEGKFLTPEMLAIIKMLVQFIPNEDIKRVVLIVISILETLDAEEEALPAREPSWIDEAGLGEEHEDSPPVPMPDGAVRPSQRVARPLGFRSPVAAPQQVELAP